MEVVCERGGLERKRGRVEGKGGVGNVWLRVVEGVEFGAGVGGERRGLSFGAALTGCARRA